MRSCLHQLRRDQDIASVIDLDNYRKLLPSMITRFGSGHMLLLPPRSRSPESGRRVGTWSPSSLTAQWLLVGVVLRLEKRPATLLAGMC